MDLDLNITNNWIITCISYLAPWTEEELRPLWESSRTKFWPFNDQLPQSWDLQLSSSLSSLEWSSKFLYIEFFFNRFSSHHKILVEFKLLFLNEEVIPLKDSKITKDKFKTKISRYPLSKLVSWVARAPCVPLPTIKS